MNKHEKFVEYVSILLDFYRRTEDNTDTLMDMISDKYQELFDEDKKPKTNL
jgi:hypothetical protein